ncbi:MAG: molybdenum cofactor guanylyltransferase [Spirochaetales bacterium]|nr:molybdenum cofactor guanylyltransferase [Spirochaetales bacterium]
MTCIILSGGNGERIGGLDKAFLTIEGEPFIERKIRQLSPMFKEIIVVVNKTEAYRNIPARIITDEKPGQGPLMGLYSGLRESSSNINFVTTVDSPFMSPALVAWLVKKIGDYDAHVPHHGGYTEPLFAAYRKSCIPFIEKTLPKRRIISFYEYVRVKYAEDDIIRSLDPDYSSFVNINSQKDFQRIINTIY